MTAPSNSAHGAMLSPDATKIETATGGFVDLDAPDPATLDLDDIAQALSLTCRYGGHIARYYSVAEHALLVRDLLAWQGADRMARLGALFHDAPEAYLGDVVAPLKYALRRRSQFAGAEVSAYDHLTELMELAIRAALRRDDTTTWAAASRIDWKADRMLFRSLERSAGEARHAS